MRRRMYIILGGMLDAAERRDVERVTYLNGLYERLVPRVYAFPPSRLDLELDNCRQSCKLAFSEFDPLENLLEDAQRRFANLERP